MHSFLPASEQDAAPNRKGDRVQEKVVHRASRLQRIARQRLTSFRLFIF
jgi:hypothetical protein